MAAEPREYPRAEEPQPQLELAGDTDLQRSTAAVLPLRHGQQGGDGDLSRRPRVHLPDGPSTAVPAGGQYLDRNTLFHRIAGDFEHGRRHPSTRGWRPISG